MWKPQNLKIKLGPKVLVDVGQAFLDTIKDQASLGESATGETLDIDWRESGQLMDTAQVSDEGQLQFPVPYAELVNNKYPFLGIAPQAQDTLNARLQPVLQAGLVFEKEG